MTIKPYHNSELSKKVQVKEMFDNISGSYDLLNHLLSFNIDSIWRKNAIRRLAEFRPSTVLDIAAGTADFAIAAGKIHPHRIIGIDISEKMLKVGEKKIQKKGLSSIIKLQRADSEKMPFANNTFDAAIVGFGVRNFENLNLGLSETFRVLNPGGTFVVLEFSLPKRLFFRHLYFFYLTVILPLIGRVVSNDSRAYSYLPESVREFPCGEDFIALLKKAGFTGCEFFEQTFGIATIYLCHKPDNTELTQ